MPGHAHLEPALDAVERACAVCRYVQARLDSVRAITKDDRSPVTIADFASQAAVASLLQEHLGAIVLVAEESSAFLREPAHAIHLDAVVAALRDSGAWPDATAERVLESIDLGAGDPLNPLALRGGGDGFWTLDPIDGTKGFLRGQQYAVSLAFITDGRPVLGILGCPNLSPDPAASVDPPSHARPPGSLFWATLGAGSLMRPIDQPAARPTAIHCRPSPDSPRLAESIESAHSDQSRSSALMATLGTPSQPLRLDSQAKYAVVARGQADVYLRLPAESGPRASYVERIWDHAAGVIIAREAGCTVTDTLGKPLDFSRGRGLEANRGIVCAAPSLHPRLIRAIAAAHPQPA